MGAPSVIQVQPTPLNIPNANMLMQSVQQVTQMQQQPQMKGNQIDANSSYYKMNPSQNVNTLEELNKINYQKNNSSIN